MNFTQVQACKPHNWEQISALIAQWAFKPVSSSVAESADAFLRAASRVIRTLQSETGAAWMMIQDDRVMGFTSLTLLPWDSQQIGFAAARIDYLVADGGYPIQHATKRGLLKRVSNEALRRGVTHLSARVDSGDMSSLHVLEQSGFITVDSILTFSIDLKGIEPTEPPTTFNIRLAEPADADKAAALAHDAYSNDRFHSDPVIVKGKADQLHATWIRNSCNGTAADAVLIAEEGEKLLGYVTCKVQRDAAPVGPKVGTIVLVASAEEARGRGVGRAMTLASLEWFRQQGCDVVEVGTQLRNITASRLYQNCGFRLVSSSISLRLVL